MTDPLVAAHAAVWDLRRELGAAWPTPPRHDALLFALTEAGELVDAWLRQHRPQYNRNHARGADVDGERADLAVMLLTALGEASPPVAAECAPATLAEPATLEEIVHWTAGALRVWQNPAMARPYTLLALYGCASQDADLLARIQVRLARIRARVTAAPSTSSPPVDALHLVIGIYDLDRRALGGDSNAAALVVELRRLYRAAGEPAPAALGAEPPGADTITREE
jgi:hypothetical protein